MNINLPNAITTRLGTVSLVAQKNSPKILFGAGIVLMGATVVTACKGTLALGEVLDEIHRDREDIATLEDVSETEIRKLNSYVTAKGIVKITKLYLPSIALGVAAVGCLTTSHNQLSRRNAGLSAALAATERALDRYRNRIREELGEEKELSLWRDERTETLEETDENGKVTKKKVKLGGGHSPYATIWGRDTSSEWDPIPEYNLAKLRSAQEYCTIMLNSKGHLFLNEVFDELGLMRTPAGSQVGWLKKEAGGHDGFVDFGVLRQGNDVQFVDFMTGDENHILLDFNVDGEIWRKI